MNHSFNDYSNRVIEGTPCIWLQYYGWAPAKPAGEFKVGEKFLWNNGYTSIFKAIKKETDKTMIVITEENGIEYERKFLKSRLVAIGK